jgi:hypothetical protein
MLHWKRAALFVSTAATLVIAVVVGASASAQGRAGLSAGGSEAVLLSSVSGSGIDAAAGGAPASGTGLGPIQIVVGPNWTLDSKLALSGQLTITCGPFLSSSNGSAFFTVSEAVGRDVAHANGSLQSLPCDGVGRTFAVTVVAADHTFRPGSGVVQASAFACGTDPSTFQFVCQNGQATANVTIKK